MFNKIFNKENGMVVIVTTIMVVAYYLVTELYFMFI